jgi:ribonuclease HI
LQYTDYIREEAQQVKLPIHYDSLRHYIGSLSTWYKRLSAKYSQKASDHKIWKSYRSREQQIDIISDGGLAEQFGTFGWKIVTAGGDTVLYNGSGPIDGPSKVGSSTRSELGGFTAPLLLSTTLAQYWGLRHRCHFTWTTDSKAAISKVTISTAQAAQHNQRYPARSDNVTTIQELKKELRHLIKMQWIKGHQDDDKPYEELLREARYNVDADELATKHRLLQVSQPMRKTAHLPSQRISLTINGTRYPGNWDSNLQWSINGFYLKQFLQQKHKWDETIWQTINFSIVKQFYGSKGASKQRQWFKFMHNLQPLGKRKQQMGNSLGQSTTLTMCSVAM